MNLPINLNSLVHLSNNYLLSTYQARFYENYKLNMTCSVPLGKLQCSGKDKSSKQTILTNQGLDNKHTLYYKCTLGFFSIQWRYENYMR